MSSWTVSCLIRPYRWCRTFRSVAVEYILFWALDHSPLHSTNCHSICSVELLILKAWLTLISRVPLDQVEFLRLFDRYIVWMFDILRRCFPHPSHLSPFFCNARAETKTRFPEEFSRQASIYLRVVKLGDWFLRRTGFLSNLLLDTS